MDRRGRVYVAGSSTLIGSAIVNRLTAAQTGILVGAGGEEPDFRDRNAVDAFFARQHPDYVFVAAGRTAGIAGNRQCPADLMIDSLLAAAHVIPAAWRSPTAKLLYLASSCVYPKMAPQPLHPSSLGTGALEPTSAAYATAKLAGIELCAAHRQQHGARFITAIGADVYGPGDDFSPENSHVVGALVRRVHEAHVAGQPAIDVWGSGVPRRDFIFVDDLADACVFAMEHYEGTEPLNLSGGSDVSIAELARMICEVVGYRGELWFDRSKDDGMPFKGLDPTALRGMGWKPACSLRRGLELTYEWFVANVAAP